MPFARRLVALRGEDGDVERRVVRPRPEHAVIEVEAVHLGADDVPVDLLRDRPAARIDGGEAALVGRQRALLRGHRARRCSRARRQPASAVWNARHSVEQRHQIRVAIPGTCAESDRPLPATAAVPRTPTRSIGDSKERRINSLPPSLKLRRGKPAPAHPRTRALYFLISTTMTSMGASPRFKSPCCWPAGSTSSQYAFPVSHVIFLIVCPLASTTSSVPPLRATMVRP